jgi:hypothetical protein
MISNEQLISFFRAELEAEKNSGWSRLKRIPDTLVWRNLKFHDTLNLPDQESLLHCAARLACAWHCFIFGLPAHNQTEHPFWERWRYAKLGSYGYEFESVPHLRLVIAQFKIDAAKGKQSGVSQEFFNYALSIRGMKAHELRKGVKNIFGSIGLHKVEKSGGGNYVYHCKLEEQSFQVWIDYGGRSAQLRYVVVLPEFKKVNALSQFRFERALGFGHGDWDCITELNFDDSLQMLCEAVRYSIALPKRISDHVAKFS